MGAQSVKSLNWKETITEQSTIKALNRERRKLENNRSQKFVKTMNWEKGNMENRSLSKQCTGKRGKQQSVKTMHREMWKTAVCQNNAQGKGKCEKQQSVKTMHRETWKTAVCQNNAQGNVENRSLSKCTGKRETFVKSIYWGMEKPGIRDLSKQ